MENFQSIEIRRVANGFVVDVTVDDERSEYVFDTPRKAIKFVREYVDAKSPE